MNTENPYQAPSSDVRVESSSEYQPKPFSLRGRIGRLRYLAYMLVIFMIVFMVQTVIYFVAGIWATNAFEMNFARTFVSLTPLFTLLFLLFYCFVLAIRRLQDINQPGWSSLLILVPFINIAMFAALALLPGTKGINKYGPPAPANSPIITISGFAMVALIMIATAGSLFALL